MKIYVFVDMEGISGVSGSDFVRADGCFYQEARLYYTWDINACARGCFKAGAEAVIVRDGHSRGNHAIWRELDPRVEIIQGVGAGSRMPGLEECDALILLGYHARAGTAGALLEHTYSSAGIQNMWLNGRPAGEFAIDAGIAADRGKPTIMVSGDDAVCREAREWVPEIVVCRVKQALACQQARLLPRETAHRLIEEKAAEAVGRAGRIAPLKVERPVTLRVEHVERLPVPRASLLRPGLEVIDGRTFEIKAPTVEEALLGRA